MIIFFGLSETGFNGKGKVEHYGISDESIISSTANKGCGLTKNDSGDYSFGINSATGGWAEVAWTGPYNELGIFKNEDMQHTR